MNCVTLEHFKRAASDIGSHGDNDTLPFDIDNRFIKEKHESLAVLAYDYFVQLVIPVPHTTGIAEAGVSFYLWDT